MAAAVSGTAAGLWEEFPLLLGAEAKTPAWVFANIELSRPQSSQVLCTFADTVLLSFSLEKRYK